MEATYFRRKNKINQLVKDLQLEVKSTYTPMETNYYNLQNEEFFFFFFTIKQQI